MVDEVKDLENFPRITLAQLPTPLQEAPRLSAALGGPRILVKRDDLIGLFLVGGNKIRELEFVIPDVKRKGADVIVMSGTSQSNYGVQLAAVAGKLGMEVILLLDKGADPEPQGPRLLSSLYGAHVEIFDVGPGLEPMVEQQLKNKKVEELVAELRGKDRNPFVLDLEMPLAKVGYVDEIREICDQLQEQGTTVHYLVVANGAGCTMGGLLVGGKYFEAPFDVIGVSILDKPEQAQRRTADMANGIARLLETDLTFDPKELTIFYDYIGEGYGIPTKEGIEAIKLVARTEGILLDPVYTGKAMAGLIDLIRKGKFTSKDTVIFLHTGGVARLFVHNKELSC
jgi:1-aminocyclopropane-1-carboxylate deaminase/D-cysteine desulfhydrase-like pyridoxal-dependent ACC family enzyme